MAHYLIDVTLKKKNEKYSTYITDNSCPARIFSFQKQSGSSHIMLMLLFSAAVLMLHLPHVALSQNQ